MKGISKTFLAGLVAVVPIAATLYLLFWLFSSAESVLGTIIRFLLPDSLYRPGMGLGAGIAVIFLVGLLMQAWVVQRLFSWAEGLVYRIPLVKTLYGSIRDFLRFFSQSKEKGKDFQQVVMVGLGEGAAELMGFVTRRDFLDLPQGVGGGDRVAVYLPLSFQIGGFTVIVPRSALRPVDMSVKEAMRFALTAGVNMKGADSQG
ncbi:MAG: DUF502 domain-containing protein [Deltaproteobacteria bacterium]|nr:DUF502 domain-containing protein [Deltaproteobacteria bacterium]